MRAPQSEAFKRWYAGSVLQNADGSPLVVYHWTPYAFTKFKAGGDKPELSGKAIWLTPHLVMAAAAHNITYTSWNPELKARGRVKLTDDKWGEVDVVEGVNVMPLYARLERPFIIRPHDFAQRERLYDEKLPTGWTYLTPDDLAKLKAHGYDGIIGERPDGTVDEIVVLSPGQVKSAIGNRGTFSRRDTDILHGLRRA